MKPDRVCSCILVGIIATSFSFLVSPVELTEIASGNSRLIQTMSDETPIFRRRRQSNGWFLPVLANSILQTGNDIIRAYNDISRLVTGFIPPANRNTQLNQNASATDMELSNSTSTTAAAITQEEFQRVVNRNINGLNRLFNMESSRALQDSRNNLRMLQQQFMEAIRPYFVSNTTARNS